MDSHILRYEQLDSFEKKEVQDFIDFLFSKKGKDVAGTDKPVSEDESTATVTAAYKKRILSVSTWSEEDLKIFDENRERFNQWTIETW